MTAYQVLARKWRPKTFADLVGQQHVVKALQNALDKGRLHHAYLLTGTRGVGKTTIARILAKSLNCENARHGEPCGVCSSCQAIDAGRFVDLLEIDAASNTGIDNIREVLENAQYAPTAGKYKVYIIDEVHMLSKSAFNAMLKTLEEPPEHVKFILATTDPHKVPITVLSRCLQFVLRNMTAQQVAEHLAHVLKSEQIVYEPAALALLGRAAQGSMRDALSLLDQAIAMGSGSVKEQDVRDMIGAVDKRYLYELLDGLVAQDGERLIAKAQEMATNAIGFDSALGDLAALLQRLALIKTVPAALDSEDPEYERLQHLSRYFSDEQIQLYYQCVIHGKQDLPLAPDEYAGFVMTLLRMLAFAPFAAKNTPLHGTIEGTQLHDKAEKKTELNTPQSGSTNPNPIIHSSVEDVQPVSGSLSNEIPASPQPEPQSIAADVASNDETSPPWDDARHIAAPQAESPVQTSRQPEKRDESDLSRHLASHSGSLKSDMPPFEEMVHHAVTHAETDDELLPVDAPEYPAQSLSGSIKDESSSAKYLSAPAFDAENAWQQETEKAEKTEAGHREQLSDSDNANHAPMPEFNAANWAEITRRIAHQISAARMGLDNMAWVDLRDEVLYLAVDNKQSQTTLNPTYFNRIADAINRAYGFNLRIQTQDFETDKGWETPAMFRARHKVAQREQARAAMEQDSVVQEMQKIFNAKWMEQTIEFHQTV